MVMALASQADAQATRRHNVKLGFYMGYAPPGTSPLEPIAIAQEAERLGYDSAWAAEAWGTDCVTVLSWLGATTERIKLGSAIMQIPGRTPAGAFSSASAHLAHRSSRAGTASTGVSRSRRRASTSRSCAPRCDGSSWS